MIHGSRRILLWGYFFTDGTGGFDKVNKIKRNKMAIADTGE